MIIDSFIGLKLTLQSASQFRIKLNNHLQGDFGSNVNKK